MINDETKNLLERRRAEFRSFSENPSQENIQNLISFYKEIEKSFFSSFNFDTAINLVLLLSLTENWNEVKKYKHKMVSVYKMVEEKNSKFAESVFKIASKFKAEPYSNIFENLSFLQSSNNMETSFIVREYIKIYEEKQATFLAGMYKVISEKELINNVSPHVNKNNLDGYLSKYGFKKIEYSEFIDLSGFITIKSQDIKSFSSFDLKANLVFLNKNATDLDNISKSNPFIYGFSEKVDS